MPIHWKKKRKANKKKEKTKGIVSNVTSCKYLIVVSVSLKIKKKKKKIFSVVSIVSIVSIINIVSSVSSVISAIRVSVDCKWCKVNKKISKKKISSGTIP